jgi:hypothetical protein
MQSKEFQRLISRGMPNSIGAAEAWREAALKVPPKKRQAGSAKRVRQEGELTAKQMAEALGICEQSVYMYWTAGMPRTSVEALAWRDACNMRASPSHLSHQQALDRCQVLSAVPPYRAYFAPAAFPFRLLLAHLQINVKSTV